MTRFSLLFCLLALLCIPSSALAAKVTPTPSPSPESRGDEMTTEIVHINHIEPSAAAEGSPVGGAGWSTAASSGW